jgi:hypothetical protein
VVRKNCRQICGNEADSLEGSIIRNKDGQVDWTGSTGNIKNIQSGSLVKNIKGNSDILWNSKKVINNVNNTTGKLDILLILISKT